MNNGNLEKEQHFLLKSLKDLDEEFANGEISSEDHASLTRSYSKRLARLGKSKENDKNERNIKQRTKTWLWVLFLVSIVTISGFAISLSSGDRTSSEGMTGSIRQSIVTKLSQAQELFNDQSQWTEAIDLYEQVLEQQPSNPEALTYRAWLQYRQGESSDELIAVWQEVLIIQPDFPDAIVFLAIALSDESRYTEAAQQLKNLERIQVSKEFQSVLLVQGLRGEVFAEAEYETIIRNDEPTLQDLGMSIEVALEAANYLLQSDKQQRSVSALKLFRAILQEEPSNPAALSRESLLLAQTGDPLLYERARTQMDKAIQDNPMNLEALLTRATINADVDPGLACEDLVTISDPSFSSAISQSVQLQSQINSLNTYLACND